MKVVKAFPPNYPQIRRMFPYVRGRAIIFAFGDRIYNPGGGKIGAPLLAHEGVHCARQGADPDGWWSRYLTDASFRFDEEVLAHRAEFRSGGDLDVIARRLCSPLYGAEISLERCRALVSS